jgi:hypothetical protein
MGLLRVTSISRRKNYPVNRQHTCTKTNWRGLTSSTSNQFVRAEVPHAFLLGFFCSDGEETDLQKG